MPTPAEFTFAPNTPTAPGLCVTPRTSAPPGVSGGGGVVASLLAKKPDFELETVCESRHRAYRLGLIYPLMDVSPLFVVDPGQRPTLMLPAPQLRPGLSASGPSAAGRRSLVAPRGLTLGDIPI